MGSIGLLAKIYHECLLARSACVVADKAVDLKLIKEANPVIPNICMCLTEQAVNALSKNAQIWVQGGGRHMTKTGSFQQWNAFE
jgi:hypothetical protein